MESVSKSGGGSATSGGVEYQARVAAWIAVCILARHKVTPPWSLAEDTRLEVLWGETDQPVDDLLVGTSAGGFAFLQIKRRLDLGHRVDSEIASAIDQIVRQFLRRGSTARGRAWERPLDPPRDRLVLVTGRESSKPVRIHLPRILERLAAHPPDHGLDVASSEAEKEALSVLLVLVRASWRKYRGSPPHENEILHLARVLQIHILDVEAGGSAEDQAKDRLRHLLIHPDQAGAAWSVLIQEALRLSSHRSGAYEASLRQLLDKERIALLGATSKRRLLSSRQLLEISQATLPIQIQHLSREKYDSRLFVARRQIEQIESFLDAESWFRTEAARLLDRLSLIAGRFRLDRSPLDTLLTQSPTPGVVESILPTLKRAFWFDAVESVLTLANSAIHEPLDLDFQKETKALLLQLEKLPFVSRQDLKNAAGSLLGAHHIFLSGGIPEPEAFWSLLPCETSKPAGLANSLLKDLADLTRRSSGQCAAVVGRAGHGKTNLLCSLAEDLAREYPVFLLSGQMTISSEYEIEVHIQRWLERGLGQDCSGWLGAVGEVLEDDVTWMFVVIDAVNENADPGRMSHALESFATRCRGKRIKLILSCRDIFWPIFDRKLRPSLYGREPIPLHEFSEVEWKQAVKVYFERFGVRCRLRPAAESTLRNPLLLRLFCQANQGKDLGEIQDLRVLDVFDQFIENATAQITERSVLTSSAHIEHLLMQIGEAMWVRRRTTLRPSEVGVIPQEQSAPLSIYNQLRSEGILVESVAGPATSVRATLDCPVQFLHEPFAEYVIGSAWRHRLEGHGWDRDGISRLLDEAIEALPTFSPTLGAILFLSRMHSPEGELIQEALRKIATRGDEYLASQQPAVIAAFENLPIARAGDEILQILVRFEALAVPESKDALAPVILRLLRDRRDHPLVRTLAFHLLEVDPALLAPTSPEKHLHQTAAGTPSQATEIDEAPPPALPPARHHYPQETRLTALSILVASEREAPDVFIQGARKLGNLELHRALDAFRSLDRASDTVVISVIEHQMEASTPEYRLFCAWLLRKRYGPRPAGVLVRLLTDPQTRVHRYAFRLFQERRVEGDLIEAILIHLTSGKQVASWHLAPLLDLLSRPDRFEPANLLSAFGQRVCSVLQEATEHPSPVVRKAAFQGLLTSSLEVELEPLRQRITVDRSLSVQALATSLI